MRKILVSDTCEGCGYCFLESNLLHRLPSGKANPLDGGLFTDEQYEVVMKMIATCPVKAIKSAFRPELRVLGIVMNKIDQRRNLTKKTLKACNEAFGKSKALLHTTISIDTAIPNAHAQKIPVRKLHWRSRTVSQFSELTREILERMSK